MVREQSIESFYTRLRESAIASASCHVLESDSIRYACYPVSSFKEIHKYAGPNLTSSSDEPITILLINWGCHRDLRRDLEIGPSARVFVVDSHRPIHLHNLSDQNDRVVVLYTRDDEHQADLAYDFDVSALANASDLNSDDEVEDDSDSEDENETDNEEEGGGGSRKRRRVSEENESNPVKLFRKLKREYYYMGTFHGKPSGCLISGNLDAVTSVTLKDGTKVHVPDSSRISYEDEPRLMLLQEWNLFDSMLCSSYIATKLKTWSDNGLKKMLLLARMGFAREECKQKFQYMSVEIKHRMKDMFEQYLPEFGLTDFYYRVSFYCMDKLETGMRQAIKVQRAVLRQGSTAITKKGSIRSGSKFRWVKLEDSADTKLLCHPQALTKFGYFLMDALREKGARMKPLICVCYTQEQKKVLIVGICGKPRLGAVQGNAFGIAFRSAAEETGAEYFHELFESSWIVLEAVAVNSFMIRLTEKLL
ncbi:UNVERIFIED_CONTAM: Cell division control protein 45 [Sesamum radiatum]|uniref:Cell division control protein 45 n=1 Tax=Sesamum radiatum TaxID=300843 RepID=A0AAW2UMR8_SESRA